MRGFDLRSGEVLENLRFGPGLSVPPEFDRIDVLRLEVLGQWGGGIAGVDEYDDFFDEARFVWVSSDVIEYVCASEFLVSFVWVVVNVDDTKGDPTWDSVDVWSDETDDVWVCCPQGGI